MLIVAATSESRVDTSYDADEESADEDDNDSRFQICARNQLQQLLLNMADEDCEYNHLWSIPE